MSPYLTRPHPRRNPLPHLGAWCKNMLFAPAAIASAAMLCVAASTLAATPATSQKALVPQLYARVQPGDPGADGALLSGRDVQINTSQAIANSGTIQGRRTVNLAAANITNQLGTIQGTDVTLAAGQDINNTSGTVTAQDSLSLAAGQDINITSQASASTNGSAAPQQRAALSVTGAGGTLNVNAGQDINLTAAQVQSAGNATLNARRDVNLAALSSGEQLSFRGSGDATFAQDISQPQGHSADG